MRRPVFISLAALPLILACTVVFADPPAPPAPVAVTQIVIVPADTVPAPVATEEIVPVIINTATITVTPSPTVTATSAFPIARLIKDANCRSGPGTAYATVIVFATGQVLEIVGRNPNFSNTWWKVKIPNSNGRCWISLTVAQASGDFDSIPVINPPY